MNVFRSRLYFSCLLHVYSSIIMLSDFGPEWEAGELSKFMIKIHDHFSPKRVYLQREKVVARVQWKVTVLFGWNAVIPSSSQRWLWRQLRLWAGISGGGARAHSATPRTPPPPPPSTARCSSSSAGTLPAGPSTLQTRPY